MRFSVTEIMTQVAATVNQEASPPATGGSEYNLWLQYINRAVDEWSNANDWESLRKVFTPSITGVSLASVALPLDFKKLAGYPKLYDGSIETGVAFPEIIEEEEDLYSSVDKYVTVTGNPGNGQSLVFHPGTLASGASLLIPYYSTPTSLASPAEVPVLQDSQFIVDRVIGYIFEARSDGRFQLQEQKARERLLTMIEDNNLNKFNSYAGANPVRTTTRVQGFRMGRD